MLIANKKPCESCKKMFAELMNAENKCITLSLENTALKKSNPSQPELTSNPVYRLF